MNDILETLKRLSNQATLAQNAVREVETQSLLEKTRNLRMITKIEEDAIYKALEKLSVSLANSYAQTKLDAEAVDRKTWISVAHETREVLRKVLDALAPEEEVAKQPWCKVEERREIKKSPTYKQRAQYILRQKGEGSRTEETLSHIELIEELIGKIVRETYTRASIGAHTETDRKEAAKIIKHFELLALDLLDVEL